MPETPSSPNGALGPEDSQVRPLTAAEAKALIAASSKTTARLVTSADVKWFVGTMVAVAVFSVTVAFTLDARADDKVKESEVRTGKRIDKLETSSDRQDRKLDAMLFAFGVPNPAPAPPKDGGQ